MESEVKKMVLVKICDICSREFETIFESKKHCSAVCVNQMARNYQRTKARRFKELEKEIKELRKQLQEKGQYG